MTHLITEIKTAITSRLKAPLLGNLAISFALCNYKGIGIFLLSDNAIRKQILLNYDNIAIDMTCAAFITIIYVVVSQFITPYIQDEIDTLKLAKVDIKRFQQRTRRLEKDFEQQAKSNEMLVKSEPSYLREKALRELSQWEKEKEQLVQIKQQLEETKAELNESKIKISQLEHLEKNADVTQENLKNAHIALSKVNIELQKKSTEFTNSINNDNELKIALKHFENAKFVEIYNMPPGDESDFNAILSLSKQAIVFAEEISSLEQQS
ncbi:hypothetical protein EDB60_110163 [Vibrio crassostreae]|uniref:hypothetical protein n=1 Tax=Vibrio crassostreae TaxID=246167 RepID=UPI00104A729C|nr:hypothetical protein [Vibrio crassostreae]TCN66972.1 hypothetical protein EDB60_110163 [Vibrio crassostreae]